MPNSRDSAILAVGGLKRSTFLKLISETFRTNTPGGPVVPGVASASCAAGQARMQRSGARCRAAAGALTPSPVATRAVVRSSARATGSTLVLNAAMMTVTRSFQSMVPPHAGRAHCLLREEAPPFPPVTSKEKMQTMTAYGFKNCMRALG